MNINFVIHENPTNSTFKIPEGDLRTKEIYRLGYVLGVEAQQKGIPLEIPFFEQLLQGFSDGHASPDKAHTPSYPLI